MMDQTFKKRRNPEDGYELWLRYEPIVPGPILTEYRAALTQIVIGTLSATLEAAREELTLALERMLETSIPILEQIEQDGTLIIGTPHSSALVAEVHLQEELLEAGDEGFVIIRQPVRDRDCIVIAGNTDVGVLYGVFHFLRHLQTHQPLHFLSVISAPKIKHRLLNHWDNLDRTVERGYAGFSLWDWHKLPDYLSPQYKDYARANASIGINGTVLTNVNANALILTRQYLIKVAALADVFRPYGIRVYLTARFSAPIEIGGLKTADPLDSAVIAWWNTKAAEIYEFIPDFGGFVVKANSEGQP
ncbi:MAG: alpha-glucuronidase, partial [Chloroflexi bacterium]|nr:alpha-glucuronidase [Chloroflexota bacterium]